MTTTEIGRAARCAAVVAAVFCAAGLGFAPPAAAGGGPHGSGAELVGAVEALPSGGLIGDWTVAGVTVHVTDATEIDQEHGDVAVGVTVKVEGTTNPDSSIDAREIATMAIVGPAPNVTEFTGAIETLPSGGLIGDWTVAGVTVHVSAATMIDDHDGAVEVGAVVEVKGVEESDGSVTALKISVEDAAPGAGPHEADLHGIIESLPSGGLIGDWTVSGIIVHVAADTVIDDSHGPVEVGAKVEVSGTGESDGSITAAKIEVLTDGGENSGNGKLDASSLTVLHLTPTASAPANAEGVVVTRSFIRSDGSLDEDLKVAVEDLLPDTIYEVMIDGFDAGPIQTNSEGEGHLFLSSRDIPGAEPLPAELRPVSGLVHAEVVDPAAVPVLVGDFADAQTHDHTNPGLDFAAVALLRDASGNAIGMAFAKATSAEQELDLRAWGLAPSSDYSVVIDGTDLATITTDAEGMLEAEFVNPADGTHQLLPDLFLPVSGLLHVELYDSSATLVASGDFTTVAAPGAMATTMGTARRRLGGH